MKEIKLTQEQVALVDDEDHEYLNKFNWNANEGHSSFYAHTRDPRIFGMRKFVSMHRLIMKVYDTKILVDHIDGNGLNNQKSNLRLCNHSQNLKNRRSRGNSKYLGVYKKTNKIKWKTKNGEEKYKESIHWEASIKPTNMKRIYIGIFKSEENAAIAYNIYAEKYHGEFARYNKV